MGSRLRARRRLAEGAAIAQPIGLGLMNRMRHAVQTPRFGRFTADLTPQT
jgi:hypothetical protein